MRRVLDRVCLVAVLLAALCGAQSFGIAEGQSDPVAFWRLPEGAIQPQAQVDSQGIVHLIYFKQGEADGVGNLFYMRLTPGQDRASAPIRVNSDVDTAGSVGTVRAAQIAIGKDDRVHVVWNGLGPKAANGYPVAYQAYTCLNSAGTAFEKQRNLITWARGLDGGGSVAADRDGNVYVAWHALANAKDEMGRAVYVAHSADNGETFTREKRANPDPTGACACCGLRAFVDSKGALYILYRAAGDKVNRDTMLLVSQDRGKTFTEKLVQPWNINACPMSTYSLAQGKAGILASWETRGRIYYGAVRPADLAIVTPTPLPGDSQKHPFITTAPNGQTLLTWTEGTGWQKGGTLAWQVIGVNGATVASGRKPGAIPVWGLATAYARPDGKFVIIY